MSGTEFIVGLGANLGAREASLRIAVDALEALPGTTLLATSRLYETAPLGPPQPDFLNAAVRLRTTLLPEELLEQTLAIEASLGRRRIVPWGPRTLDLDLLHWAGGDHASACLTLPHPRLLGRTFALAPLLDVAPELEGIYGAPLASLGGRPERIRAFSRHPRARLLGGSAAGIGSDSFDAVSAVLTEVGRRRSGRPRGRLEVRSIAGNDVAGDAGRGLASLAGALSLTLASGFAIRQVSCQRLEGGPPTAFVLGQTADPGAGFGVEKAWVAETGFGPKPGGMGAGLRLSPNDL